jgi:hypothetical protein
MTSPVARSEADQVTTGKSKMTKKQALTITTRASDGAIGIRFNGRHVVTITKSGRKARIAGKNLHNIRRGTHRGVNRFQFDL